MACLPEVFLVVAFIHARWCHNRNVWFLLFPLVTLSSNTLLHSTDDSTPLHSTPLHSTPRRTEEHMFTWIKTRISPVIFSWPSITMSWASCSAVWHIAKAGVNPKRRVLEAGSGLLFYEYIELPTCYRNNLWPLTRVLIFIRGKQKESLYREAHVHMNEQNSVLYIIYDFFIYIVISTKY